MIKIKVKDWNKRPTPWAGRKVVIVKQSNLSETKHEPGTAIVWESIVQQIGTLTGYVPDGEYAKAVRVAFSPDEWADFPVEEVALA